MATNNSRHDFIAKIYPAAIQASKETGMSWELILAQAALETGWGEKTLPGTNNLFNIKADKSWQGESKVFRVWEMKGKEKVWQNDAFRVYKDYTEAFTDRAHFLQKNPRYEKAGLFDESVKGNMEAEARALQKAGYATDPQYAEKLVEIFNGKTMQQALKYAQEQSQKSISQDQKNPPQNTNAQPVEKEQVIQKLLASFEAEKGYTEGKNNHTKYAKEYFPNLQNQPWCDTLVDSMFVKTFGKETAEKMLGGFSAYTPTSAKMYQDMGRWHKANGYYIPQPGDQIFFQTKGGPNRINHTGIVTRVDQKTGTVYTIEGNTSAKPGDRDGTIVKEKSYSLNNSAIKGYGTPQWDKAINQLKNHKSSSINSETANNQADPKSSVRQSQSALNQLGYKGVDGKPLAEDGISGQHTKHAVKAFQDKHGLEANGVIDAKTAAALEAAKTKQQAPAAAVNAPKDAQQQATSPVKNAVSINPGLTDIAKKFFPESTVKQIESLGEKIAEAVARQQHQRNGTNINVNINVNINLNGSPASEQHCNLTLYCASRCAKENLPLNQIGNLALEQTKEGKNLIHMLSSNQQQVVTANADKGKHTPAEQSIASMQQQNAQQAVNPPQQRTHMSI